MVKILEADGDIDCVACYQAKHRESVLLKFCKKIFYKLMGESSKLSFQSDASDFRLFRRNVVEAILAMQEKIVFLRGFFPASLQLLFILS